MKLSIEQTFNIYQLLPCIIGMLFWFFTDFKSIHYFQRIHGKAENHKNLPLGERPSSRALVKKRIFEETFSENLLHFQVTRFFYTYFLLFYQFKMGLEMGYNFSKFEIYFLVITLQICISDFMYFRAVNFFSIFQNLFFILSSCVFTILKKTDSLQTFFTLPTQSQKCILLESQPKQISNFDLGHPVIKLSSFFRML